ncbi:MobV family relaxase [Phaeobacter piscinae]|uniref:MobV family relaxase n=1 Tax=Phaeobacter piscinae TaxID=1580596 RepID=UPI000BC0ADB9|nr:MobV family relaxase [Phaeobacter piscinae]ATG41974.1 Plasmid recombination enzyme [Phaeobacter piscinae]
MQQDKLKKFAIIRTQKVKNLAEFAGRSRHNSRAGEKGTEHATNPNPRFGGGARLLAGENDAVAAWHKKLAERGIDPNKLRKDSVKAVEMVLTASGDWFDSATDKDRVEWVRRSLSFAKKKFGAENILSAHLHDDEETPHLQILAAPLVFKGRAKRGRARKGREGAKRAPQPPAWGLSAKDFIGGSSAQHTALQTAYWESIADLGLRRGIPRKESGARNLAPAKWRALQANEHDKARETTQAAERDRKKAAQTLSKAEACAEALTVGIDAIAQGELIYRPTKKPAAVGGLKVVKEVEQPMLPQSFDALARWRETVRPYWSALVGFARRFASVQEREQNAMQLSHRLDEERDAHLRTAARQARHEHQSGIEFGPAQKDTQIIAKARNRGERQR